MSKTQKRERRKKSPCVSNYSLRFRKNKKKSCVYFIIKTDRPSVSRTTDIEERNLQTELENKEKK